MLICLHIKLTSTPLRRVGECMDSWKHFNIDCRWRNE